MNKIIFLDIDGVLNTVYSLNKGVHLIPEKARLVNALANMTGADIVISSAWRYDPNLTHMLWRVGLETSGLKTPYIHGKRGIEIDSFMEDYPNTDYIIIDDEDFDIHQKDRLVKTDTEKGINMVDVFVAANKLGVEKYLYMVSTKESPGLDYFYYHESAGLTYEEVVNAVPQFRDGWETPTRVYNLMLAAPLEMENN